MARGWESKSVEEQQAEAASTPARQKPPLTLEQSAHQRERQGLILSRKHVLQQLEAIQNPRHRKMLQDALTDWTRSWPDWAKSVVSHLLRIADV